MVEVWRKSVACGGRKGNKEKEKKEKKLKVKIFSWEKNKNNESGGFPGFSCGCGKHSEKYRNRPKFKYLGTTRNNYQKSRIIF